MAADKQNIWIRIAEGKPIALSINREDEQACREAEKMVNTLYAKYATRFDGVASAQEVMARVAFQMARLYAEAYQQTNEVNKFLADFEQKLNAAVVNM